MNPFTQKPRALDACISDWKTLCSKPYNKNSVDPYTKIRIILMNGTEYEAVWFSHQFQRHCMNDDLRRELAMLRRIEQQQQKRIAALKPIDESILETTIGYEMLAVDLTVALAKCEKDEHVKRALNLALLEDFDHLYRYSNLLEGERHIHAEKLVGKYVEIMPGRPTISEHRHPFDDIRPCIDNKTALPQTKLNVSIITAAEQQTMNYYMNIGQFYDTPEGRRLYTEIGMIEEQHVSQYGSLIDTSCTALENLLMHEYTECYLYYSCYKTETDERIKGIWEEIFEQEVAHLHKAAELLQTYEKKQWEQVIPDGTFPAVLKLQPGKEYVRKVLDTVNLTAHRDQYLPVRDLPEDNDFKRYQSWVNPKTADVPSHKVMENYIAENGKDYRYEESEHPVEALRDRTHDNTEVGR